MQTPIPTGTPPGFTEQISQFLGAASWGGIGVLITLLVGVPALYLGWKAYSRKSLLYEIVSDVSLLSAAKMPTDLGQLVMSLDGTPIKNVRSVVLDFALKGNGDIRVNDYDPQFPLTLDFGTGVKFLKKPVVTAKTEILGKALEPTTQNGKIEFPTTVISRGSWFRLELVIGDYEGALPKPSALIADIGDIRRGESIRQSAFEKMGTIPIFLLPALIIGIISNLLSDTAGEFKDFLLSLAFLWLGLILFPLIRLVKRALD